MSGTLRYEGVTAFVEYSCGEEILFVSPAPNGTPFNASAVETDLLFDDDLGSTSFGYSPGGIVLDLGRISIDLSW